MSRQATPYHHTTPQHDTAHAHEILMNENDYISPVWKQYEEHLVPLFL